MNSNKISNALVDAADTFSDVMSQINPKFILIKPITFSIRRVIGLVTDKSIVERMNRLSERLESRKISELDFKKRIENMNEHNKYVLSNNLSFLLLKCVPEYIDIYIEILIDLIMNQDTNIYEELCEVLSTLNVNDLKLLKMIKEYLNYGKKQFYNEELKHQQDNIKDNEKIDEYNNNSQHKLKLFKHADRSIMIDGTTIFWNDFIKYYDINLKDMGFALLVPGYDEDENETYEWAFIIRAFVKLVNLGLIVSDFVICYGTSSNTNIDRFHVSYFCKKLLSYIEINNMEENSIICTQE